MVGPTIEPGCPWYELSLWGLPDIDWCEASRCSVVVEPANTWSNLFFFVSAIVLWRWSRRHPHEMTALRWFAPSAFALGLFSFVYHASTTFVLQVFDFLGMFLFLGLALALNLRRLHLAPFAFVWLAMIGLGTGLVFLLRWQGANIQPIVGLLIATIVLSELACRYRRVDAPSYGWYLLAIGLLSLGGVFSLLDLSRTWCNPENHLIQGHALWHLSTAAAMLPLYRFYETVTSDQ